MDVCVIDASVVIQYFVTQPLNAQATALFARLYGRPALRLRAPDLIYAECANALWKYIRFSQYEPRVVRAHMADILRLPVMSTGAQVLADRALGLAVSYGITAYDACYVALADVIGCPLVTADQRLVQRVPGASVSVQWPGAL